MWKTEIAAQSTSDFSPITEQRSARKLRNLPLHEKEWT